MIRKAVIHSQTLIGLRTRYVPRSRIGQGLISLAPWLNLMLLLFFFLLLDSKVLLQPGVELRMAEAPFVGGSPPGVPAVVLAIESTAGREEIVVLDDERYLLSSPYHMQRFRDALSALARTRPDTPLILYVDERIGHGKVQMLVGLAREAGVRLVNLSARAPALNGTASGKP